MTGERILFIKFSAYRATALVSASALAPAVIALFSLSTAKVIAADGKEANVDIIAPAFNQSLDSVPLLLRHKEESVIEKGAVLLGPKEDTVVDTPYGTVSVGADSVVLLVSSDRCLGVYDLLAKGNIGVETGSASMAIGPGHCAILTNLPGRSFEEMNPCRPVAYRNIASRSVGGGIQLYEAEFAVTSMVHALPLQSLIHSEKADVRKTMARMMAAEVRRSHLSPTSEPFRFYLDAPIKEHVQSAMDEWLWPK